MKQNINLEKGSLNMIRKFRTLNLIISQFFIALLSIKLGAISSDWMIGTEGINESSFFMILLKIIIFIISIISINFILSNINWLLFKISSWNE